MNATHAELAALVGAPHVLTQPEDTAPYTLDWRQRYQGHPLAVVRPSCTAEVVKLVQFCATRHIPMVPQGGNTSTCGGATPDGSGQALVISLSRLRCIRQIDPANNTLIAEAGVTLAGVQAAAYAAHRLFPLSLASEGSCQIGGNLATNAGGMAVLRYGTMRDLTLGIEAVLPNGVLLEALAPLRKNNTGYDLKQLLIGGEGTLGIITAASLKLYPIPTARATALVPVSSPNAAVALLRAVQDRFGDRLTTFELISERCFALVAQHTAPPPLPFSAPWGVLLELSDGGEAAALNEALLHWLADHPEASAGSIVAQSQTQRDQLWHWRETISEAQKRDGPSIKHDIAVPISQLGAFMARAETVLRHAFPLCEIVAFGHVGDGNLHYNVSHTRPDNADLFADEPLVNTLVYDLVYALGGTLSAEHGIGQLKRDWLAHYSPPAVQAARRTLKTALDPLNLMNPGKLL